MQKMKSKKGFTLIEMLIVVGIIAILVAVSIPMVNSSLEKARRATDAANERAAKAEFTIKYLSENDFPTSTDNTKATHVYDAASGDLKTDDSVAAYGKSDGKTTMALYGCVDKDGGVHLTWGNEKTKPENVTIANNLIGIEVDKAPAVTG